MPRVATGQRKRAYKPKTRSGCSTCKIRRIKCDESKPSCNKCTSTGRKCDGYEFPVTDIDSRESKSSTRTLENSPSFEMPIVERIPCSQITGSAREKHSFHFFCHQTSTQLSGLYGEEFWDKYILQASHFEPAIHHAIIALGSLHEHFMRNNGLVSLQDPSIYHDGFALEHYNLAIKCLVEPFLKNSRQNMDVCLLACILFACFESLQGSYGLAIAHVQSGGKILCEIQYDEETKKRQHGNLAVSETPYMPIELLEDIFMRLDLQVTQMIGRHKWNLYNKSVRARERLPTPAMFSSLSEARESLVFYWHRCSYDLSGPKETDDAEFDARFKAWQQSSAKILEDWFSAFSAFLEVYGHKLTDRERQGVTILNIQVELAFTSLRISRPESDDQTVYDQFCPVFGRIVDLASEVIDSDSKSRDPSFSLDMGVVGPLFDIAARCRDPIIRRKAVALLKSASIQEGIWNSYLISLAAEKIVQIEEEGLGEVRCCEDVPNWARISEVNSTFDPVERRSTAQYVRVMGKDGSAREMVEAAFEW